MLKAIKYYASVGTCFLRLSVQRQVEYPLFLVSWFLMIPIMYSTGILLLYFMVENYQPLNGWTFPQLAFLYGLGDISHGIMIIAAIQTWWIERLVIQGEFDRMLLRPANVFFQFLVMNVNFIGIMDVLTGVVIFAYGCHLVHFKWTVLNTIKVLAVVLGAAVIRSSLYCIVCSAAFWTKRSRPLVWLVHDTMDRTTLYPMSLYPYIMQIILTFIIPIAFISFYPTCDFLGQNDRFTLPLGLSIWTPVAGILMFILANLVFNRGLRNYESAGS